jgi:hypothetical protein
MAVNSGDRRAASITACTRISHCCRGEFVAENSARRTQARRCKPLKPITSRDRSIGIARRLVKTRDGNESGVTEHVHQNFHPNRHRIPLCQCNTGKGAIVPAQSGDLTSAIAWLAERDHDQTLETKTPSAS